MKKQRSRMLYLRRDKDIVLKAVIAEINKSVVRPEPGFMRRDEWTRKWKVSPSQTNIYIKTALKAGVMVMKRFRVLVAHGRVRLIDHFAPAPGLKHKKTCPPRQTKL